MATSRGFFEPAFEPKGAPEKTLVLIGTALDGPARIPFRLTSAAYPIEVLGNSPLYKAYEMASKAGAEDIILYRLNGVHARRVLYGDVYDPESGTTNPTPLMEFTAVAAGGEYNSIRINITQTHLTVYNTEDKEAGKYYFHQFPTLNDLESILNADAEYGSIQFYAKALLPSFPTQLLYEAANGDIFLRDVLTGESGDDEAHLILERNNYLDELKDRLLTALYSPSDYDKQNYILNSDLASLDAGIFCLVDMFHDDEKGFDEILGNFCFKKSLEMGQGCIGVIGTKPIPNPTKEDVQALMKKLILMKVNQIGLGLGMGAKISSSPKEVLNLGDATWQSHLQVVVGDSLTYDYEGMELEAVPLAYSYAGLQSSLDVEVSPTNKKLDGFDYLSFEFNKEDVDKLLANGYITIVRSVRKGFVPYAGVSYADSTSPFSKITTVRIIHYVTRRLNQLIDTSIGSVGSSMTKRSLMMDIEEAIANLLLPNMVKEYELGFETQENNGWYITVKLSIVPLSEVRKVLAFVRLPFIQVVI